MPLPDPGIDAEAWLRLEHISQLGGESVRRLLGQFGAPRATLNASLSDLTAVVGARKAALLKDGPDVDRVQRSLDWLAAPENHLLTLADADYPAALLEIADPPPVLYLKGDRAKLRTANARKTIAIVGSRNATPGGCQTAEQFAQALSAAGVTVVSGLALGIDAAAHRGALAAQGSTLAVIGTGLDIVYPARNRALAHDIANNGLIISEFSLGTPANAANFPRRNRIISGLSAGVLVIEAALQSGSLITARLAAEQGRDVFAIPGSIHAPLSKGAHQLIKQGAKLVDDVNDILDELGLLPHAPAAAPAHVTDTTAQDSTLLKALGFDPKTVDAICMATGLDAATVAVELMTLEIEGVVAQLPGGKYQRLR
jgi:DNA processing protein